MTHKSRLSKLERQSQRAQEQPKTRAITDQEYNRSMATLEEALQEILANDPKNQTCKT